MKSGLSKRDISRRSFNKGLAATAGLGLACRGVLPAPLQTVPTPGQQFPRLGGVKLTLSSVTTSPGRTSSAPT